MLVIVFCFVCIVGALYAYSDDDAQTMAVLPKVELHAHLTGSVRMSTILELAKEKNIRINDTDKLDLHKCFELFGVMHKVLSGVDILKRITQEVLEDYMNENTVYLELRSTPRKLADGTTPELYVDTLVQLIEQHNIEKGDKMLVKLILSVDRSSRFKDALDIMIIATNYKYISGTVDNPIKTIVGFDFSGNPLGGTFDNFSPLFDSARDFGLGISVHLGEIRELSEKIDSSSHTDETQSILDFRLVHIHNIIVFIFALWNKFDFFFQHVIKDLSVLDTPCFYNSSTLTRYHLPFFF
jgi:adenosine deaminase